MSDGSILFILNQIKEDIDALDSKWEQSLKEAGTNNQKIQTLEDDVATLKKVVHIGNGQPSLVLQVSKISQKVDSLQHTISHQHARQDAELGLLTKSITDLKDSVNTLKQHVGAKTPKEAKLEKWKTYGKLAGVLGLTLPGIVTALGSCAGG